MKLLPLGSTLVLLVGTAILSASCQETSLPTARPELTQVVFVDADGVRTSLAVVDYTTWEAAAAVNVSDLNRPLRFENPAVPADAAFVLVFSQLLTGTSVETPVSKKQIIDGKELEIRVGKGAWENQIPVIDHFDTVFGVIEGRLAVYAGGSSVPSTLSTQLFSSTYRADGAWNLDPAARVDQNPAPAVVLAPVDGSLKGTKFIPGSVVVMHIMSDGGLKGISGKTLTPALNSKKEPIVLPGGRKVAATVVFQVAA